MPETFDVVETTIRTIQDAMARGTVTSEQLVQTYLERIASYDKGGLRLNAVLEINPDALFIARAMDQERRLTGPRGPLHGIPLLIKDNIDTHDKMHTSAGSLSLATSVAPRDACIVQRLRAAGAVILGKANMTEFANFMTEHMPSGYSSRGGQVHNPYMPGKLTPSGSSSGSAAAVAANLTAVAVGTETSGSILSPANNCSVVGIKPTVGLVSRTGIIPIAMSQDTAGPLARTVADAATLLTVLAGVDPDDPATWSADGHLGDYTRFLDAGGLRGARLGIARGALYERLDDERRKLYDDAIAALQAAGAELVDLVTWPVTRWESKVLTYEFKSALNAYLSALGPNAPVHSLKEIIEFNNAHPETTLKYGQTLLTASEATSGTLTEPEYLLSRLEDIRLAGAEGIDAALNQNKLVALVTPESRGCWVGARAGYPSIIVPAGYTSAGRPMGVTFAGRAWSEGELTRVAYAFEQATKRRLPPDLSSTVPTPTDAPPPEDW